MALEISKNLQTKQTKPLLSNCRAQIVPSVLTEALIINSRVGKPTLSLFQFATDGVRRSTRVTAVSGRHSFLTAVLQLADHLLDTSTERQRLGTVSLQPSINRSSISTHSINLNKTTSIKSTIDQSTDVTPPEDVPCPVGAVHTARPTSTQRWTRCDRCCLYLLDSRNDLQFVSSPRGFDAELARLWRHTTRWVLLQTEWLVTCWTWTTWWTANSRWEQQRIRDLRTNIKYAQNNKCMHRYLHFQRVIQDPRANPALVSFCHQ